MILKLNTWQRIQLAMLVGAAKGPASTIRNAIRLLDILDMSDAEKTDVGYRQADGMLQWDKLDHIWEIEIGDGNLESLLRELVKRKTDWMVNRNVLGIFDQLGIQE